MATKIKKKIIFYSIAILCLAIGIGIYVFYTENRDKVLEFYFFNLKNSYSVLIRTPNDKRILINGGSNSEIIRKVTSVLPFYSRRIDMLVVTNNLAKYVTGLIDIVERYKVTQVYVPKITLQSLSLSTSSDQIYDEFIETTKARTVPVLPLKENDEVILDESGVKMKVFFPVASSSFAYSKASAPELVMEVGEGDHSIFLLGTITTKIQKFLNSTLSDVGSELVFISNNASPANLDNDLLKKLHPNSLIFVKSLIAVSRPVSEKTEKKKTKKDPLDYLSNDRRFNLREGDVRVVVSKEGVRLVPLR